MTIGYNRETFWAISPDSNPEDIITKICKKYNITMTEIKSDNRHKTVSKARQELCVLLWRDAHLCYSEIACAINKDSSSVGTAVRKGLSYAS